MFTYDQRIFFIFNIFLVISNHSIHWWSDLSTSSSNYIFLQASWLTVSMSMIIVLRVAIFLDDMVLKHLQQTEHQVSLHQEQSLNLFNEIECIESEIRLDLFSNFKWICYSPLTHDQLTQLQQEFYEHCVYEHHADPTAFDFHQSCYLGDLPHLPQIQGRDQWGLFAQQTIAKNTILPWISDLGVVHVNDIDQLDESVQMNRRRLYSDQNWEIFQSAGPKQRSNPSLLANFFWCQTPNMNTTRSPFILYPPHFLGKPNCVYITCKFQSHIHSALLAWREISQGDQILMYTGSGYAIVNLYIRLLFVDMIKLIYPATLVACLLKYYLICFVY